MSFLPTGYKEPVKVGNYWKPQVGENNFRILGSAVVGNEYFIDAEDEEGEPTRKPIRLLPTEAAPVEFAEELKFFWAFPIWNVEAKKVQICVIKQAGIRKPIKALIDNPKWGDPTKYDITVTMIKTGPRVQDVEYTVQPNPKEDLDPEVWSKYESLDIDMNFWFKGGDPFKKAKLAAMENAQAALK